MGSENHNIIKLDVEQEYPDYLRDESRHGGHAHGLCFALTTDDIRTALVSGHKEVAITTQGARTGIAGGAVPEGGTILNLSRMARIMGLRYDPHRNEFYLTVQPGVILANLRVLLKSLAFDTTGWSPDSLAALERFRLNPHYFFPPDPTETSASIGGMVACNASGACTFRYGATRCYVEALEVLLADGALLSLRRGRDKADGRTFAFTTGTGRVIAGSLPDYVMPTVKNAAGYFAQDNMDLLDLFVGSEGTLGIFTAIELRLIPVPPCRCGVMTFFPSEASSIRFVEVVRTLPIKDQPVAIEYFDSHSLDLLRTQKRTNAAFSRLPDLPPELFDAVYVEYHGDEVSQERVIEALPLQICAAGGLEQASWMADSDRELERLKAFRHAVPEAVNLVIDERRHSEPGVTKLGTDMAVPDARLADVMAMYGAGLREAGLEYVVFGHIGNNHLHVNILPRSLREYSLGKDLYLQWARTIIAWGGTVSAEHGVGKFKVALLREMYGAEGIRQMRAVKRSLDPAGILNPGNLF